MPKTQCWHLQVDKRLRILLVLVSLAFDLSLNAFVAPVRAQQNHLDDSENGTLPGRLEQSDMKVLHGRIEHSESLPPVSNVFKLGVKLDVARLKAQTPNNVWYRIPTWLAGTWKIEHLSVFYRERLSTGQRTYDTSTVRNRTKGGDGLQVDAEGKIWDSALVPFVTTVEGDKTDGLMYVTQWDPVDIQDKKATFKSVETAVDIDKTTRIVSAPIQRETVHIYTPVSANLLKCISSIKVFDDAGRPLYLQEATSFELRRAPFQPIRFAKGKDLQALFYEYLENHGLANLIPPNRSSDHNFPNK